MKVFLKFADILSHTVIMLFMVGVISTAIVSSLLRYYLPMADEYREVLLEQINSRSRHISIDAEKIVSHWKPFKPGITFYGVSVKPEGMDRTIDLEKLQIEINVIESILQQRLYFDYIEIANLDLTLLQAEDGSWNLSGYSKNEENDKNNVELDIEKILERLWAIDELALHHVQLALKPYQKDRISLPNLRVYSVTAHGKKHVVAELIEGNQRVGHFVLHTSDKPTSPDFAAKAYMKIDNYRVLDLLSAFTVDSDIREGVVSNELWFEWSKESLTVQGEVDIKDLKIQKKDQLWDVQSLSSTIIADYDKDTTTVAFPEVEIQVADKMLALNRLLVTYKDSLGVQLAQADLSEVHQFVKVLPLSEKLTSVLNELSPTGSLRNIYLQLDEEKLFTLQATLDDVSVNAWKGAPRLSVVNGFLYADKKSGYVDLDSELFTLGFPNLFNDDMTFQSATGTVQWQIREDEIYVGGENLSLFSELGKASAVFDLSLPKDKNEGEPPRLNLVVGLVDGDIIHRHKVLPYILDKKLLDWLDTNIHKGDISSAGFIFHGPTTKTDVEHKVVQLWLDVENIKLSYLEDWPDVTDISGDLLLDDKWVFAEVSSAKAGGVNVTSAAVDLMPENGSRRINIKAKVDSSSQSVIRFIQNEPLSEQMNHVIDGWTSPKGRVAGDIYISSLITKSAEKPKIHVDAELKNASLNIPQHKIEVNQINGPVTFNLVKGLESDSINAQIWERPVTAKILSLGDKDEPRTSVRVEGSVEAADLAKWAQQPALQFMEGVTPFSGDIYFGSLGAGLKVSSTLEGVTVNLPQPFFKSKEDSRLMLLNLPFSGEDRELKINYGEGVSLNFLLGESGVEAAKINLGVKDATYQNKKIIVGGQILQADIEEWLEVVSKYRGFQKQFKENDSNEWTLLVDKLQIKTLTGYHQSLDTVSFDLFNTVTYWQLGLNHEHLNASLQVFDDDRPMKAHLQRVNMEFLSSKQEESGIGLADPSLSELPHVDFTIDKLIWQGEDYGEWEFKLRSYDDNITLEEIESSVKSLRVGPVDNMQSTLMWTLGDDPKTHFSGRVSADDLANALVDWGYQQEVHSKAAWFDVDSSWEGVPTDFEFNEILANIRFKLNEGNFADASSSGTGALKLIGILNVSHLIRRIKLDFSDLTKEGLAFDTVTGDVSLDHGIFEFKDPIRIKSPSSQIRLAGGVNMNTSEFDMRMGVTLPLANNLPWLALIGGLPAAAGVYVLSKIMREQVDKISSVVYNVTGSFEDPVIKFVKLFDTDIKEEKDLYSDTLDPDQDLEIDINPKPVNKPEPEPEPESELDELVE